MGKLRGRGRRREEEGDKLLVSPAAVNSSKDLGDSGFLLLSFHRLDHDSHHSVLEPQQQLGLSLGLVWLLRQPD